MASSLLTLAPSHDHPIITLGMVPLWKVLTDLTKRPISRMAKTSCWEHLTWRVGGLAITPHERFQGFCKLEWF